MNTKPFLEAAEILVRLDETERALQLLENLPAYYRDYVPPEITKLKAEIKAKITLPYDLLSDNREIPKSDEWAVQFLNGTARGQVLKETVAKYNELGVTPHIVDMGPGDFCFAIGMQSERMKFTYDCFTLNAEAKKKISEKLWGITEKDSSNYSIFVAYEIIEHLSNVNEIRMVFDRAFKTMPEHVLLSTPKYTYAKGTPNWREEGCHHLRAYSPKEFMHVCINMFPEYDFKFYDNEVMVLAGFIR